MAENKSSIGCVVICIAIVALGYGFYWSVQNQVRTDAENEKRDLQERNAEFRKSFPDIPVGDTVGPDEFEIRRRSVNSRLHSSAVQLDTLEKKLKLLNDTMFVGTGKPGHYQDDVQVVKEHRAILDPLEAKIKSDREKLKHNIVAANQVHYSDIQDEREALTSKPDKTNLSEEAEAWLATIWTVIALIGLSFMI